MAVSFSFRLALGGCERGEEVCSLALSLSPERKLGLDVAGADSLFPFFGRCCFDSNQPQNFHQITLTLHPPHDDARHSRRPLGKKVLLIHSPSQPSQSLSANWLVETYGDIRACFRRGSGSVQNTHFPASESAQERSSSTSHTTFYWLNHHTADTGRHMEQHMERQVIENEMD